MLCYGKAICPLSIAGGLEFDEGYFKKATSEKGKLESGRASQGQINVAVKAASSPIRRYRNGY
jgi:hypothetical protein